MKVHTAHQPSGSASRAACTRCDRRMPRRAAMKVTGKHGSDVPRHWHQHPSRSTCRQSSLHPPRTGHLGTANEWHGKPKADHTAGIRSARADRPDRRLGALTETQTQVSASARIIYSGALVCSARPDYDGTALAGRSLRGRQGHPGLKKGLQTRQHGRPAQRDSLQDAAPG
jgi:hypothetical protein